MPVRSVRQRLEGFYLTAFGREPSELEVRASLEFLAGKRATQSPRRRARRAHT